MPPIEMGPVRPVGAMDVRVVRAAGGQSDSERPAKAQASAQAFVRSDALDPGEAPVDLERVSEIRKAIESGTYPVIPTKVADAMIAAGILLRSGKQ